MLQVSLDMSYRLFFLANLFMLSLKWKCCQKTTCCFNEAFEILWKKQVRITSIWLNFSTKSILPQIMVQYYTTFFSWCSVLMVLLGAGVAKNFPKPSLHKNYLIKSSTTVEYQAQQCVWTCELDFILWRREVKWTGAWAKPRHSGLPWRSLMTKWWRLYFSSKIFFKTFVWKETIFFLG